MKKFLRKILVPFGIVWYIALMIAGFLAYFVRSGGPNGFSDGLGRSLTESPILMRIFFGQDSLWAGFGWFLGDLLIFFGSIASGLKIGAWLDDY
jgi:hypothetical protein